MQGDVIPQTLNLQLLEDSEILTELVERFVAQLRQALLSICKR